MYDVHVFEFAEMVHGFGDAEIVPVAVQFDAVAATAEESPDEVAPLLAVALTV